MIPARRTAAARGRLVFASSSSRAVLVGASVHDLKVEARWAMTKAFSSLVELGAWLDLMEAPA